MLCFGNFMASSNKPGLKLKPPGKRAMRTVHVQRQNGRFSG